MTWQAFLDRKPWFDEEQLFVRRSDGLDRFALVQPLTFKTIDHGINVSDDAKPMLRSNFANGVDDVREFLQTMLDLAWSQGMRPKAFEEPTNELKAVRYHLEDMRTLAKLRDRQ